MHRFYVTILSVLVLGLFAVSAGAQTIAPESTPASQDRPVLVELFTSQGCGLCPEANVFLGELDQDEDVFVLAWGVNYWDMYGWTDTYARPEYVQRQRNYLPNLGAPRPYTPHFIVDGVVDAPGWNQDQVSQIVDERLQAMPQTPSIAIETGQPGMYDIRINGDVSADALDVWLVAYAPGWAQVEVGAGENAGLDMLHYNMVKSVTYLGHWAGGEAQFSGESYRRYGMAVIIQGANGGPIYGFAHREPTGES